MDISPAVLATSDVLNAGDVLGEVTITVMGAKPSESRSETGRTIVKVNLITDVYGPERPWVMAKTPLKVVGNAWGKDTTEWIGRKMVIFNLTSVMNKGKQTGGVRIRAMSNIDKPITYMPPPADGLGKGGTLTIQPLTTDPAVVEKAVAAIRNAATIPELDKIGAHADKVGVSGEVRDALNTRRAELESQDQSDGESDA